MVWIPEQVLQSQCGIVAIPTSKQFRQQCASFRSFARPVVDSKGRRSFSSGWWTTLVVNGPAALGG